jgi:hypothetical protein
MVPMEKSVERNSNFEILRVISMIMIIGYHYVVHGHFQVVAGGGRIYLDVFSSCGKIGVNIFCLIMGYFGIMSSGPSIRKIVRLESQILFYSLLGLGIGFAFDQQLISIKTIACSIFPTITEHYWFFSAYIIVFALSGYLNDFLRGLSKESYVKLLIMNYVFFSFIPFFSLRENNGFFWNQLIWFFVMYITGAFFGQFKPGMAIKTYCVYALVCIFFLEFSFFVFEFLVPKFAFINGHTTYFRWSNSPLAVIISISMLCIAIQSKIYTNIGINKIASLVFGVYLFHENLFIQDLLWGKLLNASTWNSSTERIIHFLLSVSIVFVLGCLVELIRALVEKLVLLKPIDLISTKIDSFINSIGKALLRW